MTEKRLPVLFQKVLNLAKYFRDVYVQNSFELKFLFLISFVLFFISRCHFAFLQNQAIYIALFVFCGVQVFLLSILDEYFTFREFLFYFIIKATFIDLSVFVMIIFLAYGGIQGHQILQLIDNIPLHFFI